MMLPGDVGKCSGQRVAISSIVRRQQRVRPHPWVVLPTAVLSASLCFVLAFAAPVAAQRRVDTERSTITVRVFKSGLFRAFADDHVIQVAVAEGTVDDSVTPHVELVVDASRMRVLDPNLSASNREDVQTRMIGPEVLDVNRFPQIRFHSTDIQRLQDDRWLVRGELALHGQLHQIELKVAHEGGRYSGTTTLRQSVFAITPISIAGGTVKVKDEVTIDFDILTADR